MKEKITKFNLEDAFKALDEIEIPKVKGLRPRQLDEEISMKRVDRFEALLEDYYDIQDQNDLNAAKDDRAEEIAQAKLSRIEKIVDLDAESPEDIQPTYVGKVIIQCPQCMTMFYKDEADIAKSEEDETIVNVGEVCQHCGNEDGYTLIGKVAAEEVPEEDVPAEETESEEIPEEEPVEEESEVEETEEETEEELPESEEAEIEEESEEVEESLNTSEFEKECEENSELKTENESENKTLNESADELDKALDEHDEYIEYLRAEIEKTEKEISEAKNEFIKEKLEARLETLNSDLEGALPEAVKAEVAETELPDADELPKEATEGEEEVKESLNENIEKIECEPGTDCIAKLRDKYDDKLIIIRGKEDIEELNEVDADKVIVVDEADRLPAGYGLIAKLRKLPNKVILVGHDKNRLDGEEVKESLKESAAADLQKFVDGLDEECKDCKEDLATEIRVDKYIEDLPESCEKCEEEVCKDNKLISHSEDEVKELDECGSQIKEDVSDAEFEAMLNNPIYNEAYKNNPEILEEEIKDIVADENKTDEEKEEAILEEVKVCEKCGKNPCECEKVEESCCEEECETCEENFDEVEDFVEESFNKQATDYLTEVYGNVESFETTNCELHENKLVVEGNINFKSGKIKPTKFEFNKDGHKFHGSNKDLCEDTNVFTLNYSIKDKALITESLKYAYRINETLVENLNK